MKTEIRKTKKMLKNHKEASDILGAFSNSRA
jgi:hypothetical protein